VSNNQKPILLIDASIYIFQYYFSLPDHWFSQKSSYPTAAVYGYTTFLMRLLIEQEPKYIAACFDESLESCFRNTIYPEYKSSRAMPDEALAFQLEACKQVTELLGIKTFASERYEADDLIGSLYQSLTKENNPIAILTRDKDLGQLINSKNDYLWDYAKYKPTEAEQNLRQSQYYYDDLVEKWGVKPEQFADYLSLVGDSIDDIPGVPGIGKKSAASLLQEFNSVERMLEQSDNIKHLPIRGANSLASKLNEHHDQIAMAKALATIYCDLALISSNKDIALQPFQQPVLEEYFVLMGFPKLAARLNLLPNFTHR